MGGRVQYCQLTRYTLPETNIAPKNGWLEYNFPIGKAYFQVRTVSFREGIPAKVFFFRLQTTSTSDLWRITGFFGAQIGGFKVIRRQNLPLGGV